MLKIYDILNEIATDSIEYNVAMGKVSASKGRDILRSMGATFDGECSISIGSTDDFVMNGYLRLIPYGSNVITPGSQKSKDTHRIYGSAFNFSSSPSSTQNNKFIWVDGSGTEITNTGIIDALNQTYLNRESLNKTLSYNNVDYFKTNSGWATYNKVTNKTGMTISKDPNKQPNQGTLNKEWLSKNKIPINYKITYNGIDYVLQKGKQNNITSNTVLDNVMLDGTQKYTDCSIEFYEFNSSLINTPLNKGFNPKIINPGEKIKCKVNFFIKILKSNPPQTNCDWGVFYITQINK